jgi:two-component system sensor histidine kinase KdpD
MDSKSIQRYGFAMLAWTIAWATMFALEQKLDLANLAMLMVLASALSAIWLPGWASVVISAVAVVAFNWFFVPPKFAFSVDLYQNALLLVVLLLVNWIIAGLMIRQRRLAESAHALASREARLRQWGDTLRDASDPVAHAAALRDVLQQTTGSDVVVLVLRSLHDQAAETTALQVGEPNKEQRSGMALCLREGRAMGASSGRYEQLPDVYLPLRGRGATLGAALLIGLGRHATREQLLPHLQALCDQMGSALQRSLIAAQEQQAREEAQLQATRNALLAAISHDYRTPLATIMGAASALQQQGDRLDVKQRQQLAHGIVEESERLARLTENTLQLARLDAPSVSLRSDWESAEEIVGAVVRRLRQRPEGNRVRVWVEPSLPLLWCDAMLVSQLLDNLIDNALKYSPSDTPVELHARIERDDLILTVSDNGPGIAPAWREKVFEVFQRGDSSNSHDRPDIDRGAGVGLAVCRAIARAHQGELLLLARGEGGCCFECRLPLRGHGQSLPDVQVPEAQQ